MEDRRLDLRHIEAAMERGGFNAAAVAASLGVSRTIVSDWLNGRKYPRPRYLLELGKLLGLRHSELVLRDLIAEPMVAYRKQGNARLRPEDEAKARDMGRAIELLVPYLPLRRLDAPARLISPCSDPSYIEEAAAETRAAMGVTGTEIRFQDLIGLFAELKTVLVPVLWGGNKSPGMALHVYLPESQTTIIYLNLDVKLFDFKYWMLHELGHVKTTTLLEGEEAEAFADAFAAAVLVPCSLVETELPRIAAIADLGRRINAVLRLAEELVVSPITLAKRLDEASRAAGDGELLGAAIYGATANFNKKYGLVSASIFGPETPEAGDFITVSEKAFGTPIYAALRAYLTEKGPSEGIVAASLGIPPADAKAVLDALCPR